MNKIKLPHNWLSKGGKTSVPMSLQNSGTKYWLTHDKFRNNWLGYFPNLFVGSNHEITTI